MKRFKDLFKKIKLSGRMKTILIIALAVIVVVTGFSIWRSRASQKTFNGTEQRTATAENGDLVVTLTGSGAVAAGQRKVIQSQVAGTVSEINLEEGKAVKAGDVLVKLESTDAEINLQKMENTLKQKQLAANDQQEQLDSLSVTAPINGRISGLTLKEGDSVNKGQVICSIADESSLQLRAQFKDVSSKQLANANTVRVNIPDYSVTLDAKVKSLVQSGSDTEAVLTIENPGALSSGLSANAEIVTSSGDFISEQGSLEWTSQETVKAGASGTVGDISALDNQYVSQGKVLATLDNDGLATAVESAKLDLDQAQKDYDQAKANMEDYTITAQFDGILVSVADLNSGDDVKIGATLATLIDTKTMTMQINIDELDISQVKPDQDVKITLDALEETAASSITGKVTSVAVEGASNNGVTSYPVSISFPGMDGLKVGMNANAEIQVLNKPNVLLVPFEAVQKKGNGYIVWLKTGDAAASGTGANGSANNQKNNQRGKGFMSQLTPEQQQQIQNMTPEERQKLRDQFKQQGGAPGSGGNTQDPSDNSASSGDGTGKVIIQGPGNDSAQSGSSPAPTTGNGQGDTGGSNQPGAVTGGNGHNGTGKGNYTQAAQNPYYAGAVPVAVTVGDHNENYIEITGGLKAGDTVVLPEVTSNSSSSNSTTSKQGVMGIPMGGGGTFIQGGNTQYRRNGGD